MANRTFTFLGTGTSVGVPMVGCDCATCKSTDPRNQRYRCSVLVETSAGNILIDTPPELRLQLLRTNVRNVRAVMLTHYHADHLNGLDDVRPLCKLLGGPMPLFCTGEVEERVRQTFGYAFTEENEKLPFGMVPRMTIQRIALAPFMAAQQLVTPIRLQHATFEVLGFRFDDVAYCTDVNAIPPESWPRLEGLSVLVLDALRLKPHPAHFSLDQALEVIRKVKPRKAYLTHMGHELEHEETSRMLPRNVELAYDGLKFTF